MKSMRHTFRLPGLNMIILFATLSAHAQQVYKCGSTYSQTPCADAKTLTVQDPRSAQQKRRMDKQTVQAGELAHQMQRDRQMQEQKDMAANQAVVLPQAPTSPQRPKKPSTPGGAGNATLLPATVVPRAEKPKLVRPKKSNEFTALAPKPALPLKTTRPSKQTKEN